MWNRCGILRSIFLYIYTLRSAQDGAGTRRYATELVSPFSTLFHPVSSRYLDTTGFFSLTSYEKYLHTPFGEIKYNSFVSIRRDESLFVPPFVRFHSLLSDYFLLLLASALQYRAVRCVCSFTYLERRWSNAEKKKNTLDSSDEEELSSRNFSLRNETEFLKIINNRPGGRGRIFNFNTSFFPSSPREEEAAAFLSPRHVADRLEIRRYKDTRRRFDDRKKPYTTKEKERERERWILKIGVYVIGVERRSLAGTKIALNIARRIARRPIIWRDKRIEHSYSRERRERREEKTRWKKNAGRKKRELFGCGGGIRRGERRGFPRGSSPRSEVGVLIKPGSM